MKNLIKTLVLSICVFCYSIPQAQSLYGSYTIGTGGNYTSIAAAMTALTTYGVSGDVTFNILSGTYGSASIDFANGIPNLGTYDTITFTSITNNASQVTFSSTTTALTINNAKNLVIKDITCNASSGEKGINISGNCENLEIKNCIIRSTSNIYSSNSQAGIYYQRNYAQSALSDNIRILNNTITGGYYGIYFYGYGYSDYATNVIIDNNQISESYRYAIYSSYANFNSISKNFIIGNSTTSTSLYGLYLNYCNSNKIYRNTVRILSSSITAPYGMCFQNLNYRNTNTACLISNNEIIMSTNSTNYGMLASYSRANIFHNSILILGTGQSMALQLDVAAGYPVSVRNNNFHCNASAAYPIYIPTASMLFLGTYLTMDYNNYYNQSYIGYAGSNVTSINDWQTFTGQDAHSISIFPNYPNIASYSLETDPNQLICPINTAVDKDIRDTTRKAITSMGAYHSYIPPTYDIKAQSLLSPSKDVIVGTTVPIRISIMNMGKTPIDSIDIYFTVNGTNQVFYWRGTALNMGDTTSSITLGHFTPHAGENNILIYTKLCNGHIDSIPENDTLRLQAFGCKSSINNTYTVGSSGADFTTINEAFDVLSYCGILVPTTISILPGTYNENVIINTIKGSSETNTLTITASNGDSSSVIIQSLTTNPTLTLSNSKNVIIKNLTIKAYGTGTNSIAIKLQNSNKNISILNNYITTSTVTPSTSTPTGIMAIYSNSSLDTNLTISNNYIKGSGGIYIVSGGITSSTYNVNILNNNITEIYIYGIYSSYSRIAKIKNNRIIQNDLASISGGTSYGLYVNYSYGVSNTLTEISNNYIKGSFETFANLYYCINVDNYYSDVLFTNNSFIKTGSGNTSDMLYINYGQWQIINNTFVNIGDGFITDMVHIASSSSTNINFSNNILTNLNLYCSQLINWNVSYGTYTIDYNNYYTING
ncbi:MAG: hypothetical protein GX612_09190, partial [Bacteroidales bacterium]|nr:hypothetical protein [Bacteroidales bacterium]